LEYFLNKTARAFAVCAGIMLCLLALVVVLSILGRLFFLMPVPGDFEIVGIGTAIAIFLCLPYCQLKKGHVAVDVFLSHVSHKVQQRFDALAGIIFGLLSLLFAWQMMQGFNDMFTQHDISMIVGIPLWVAFPFGVASFLLLSLCCFHTAHKNISGSPDD
jgi:TRAP-type C4-dicarboxylate transport system permease small subunit